MCYRRAAREDILKKTLCLCLLACFALIGKSAYCDEKDDLIASVMDVTGITRQLGDASNMISTLYTQNQKALDPKYYNKVVDLIAKQFGETAFADYVRKQIRNDYDEGLLRRIIVDYKNPLFIRITQREVESTNEKINGWKASFDYSGVGAARDEIFNRYIDEGKVMDLGEKMLVESLYAFFSTFNMFLAKERKIPDETIQYLLEGAKKELRSERSMADIKIRFAITYEPFSDKELGEYFSFYGSDEGRWMNERFINGVSKAFQQCLMGAAQEIMGILKDA
jgi:hypothetical protein